MDVYVYKNCDSCRKALKYLNARGIKHVAMPIRENPPSPAELKTMLKRYNGDLRKLFNSAGGEYKALNLKEKLSTMTQDEAIALLSTNGNLVKRAFVLGKNVGLLGFRQAEWDAVFD